MRAGTLVPVTVEASPAEGAEVEGAGVERPEAEGDEGRRPRRRRGRVAVALAIVLMVSMWGYVLYLAFGPGRQPPIDRLDDPAFAEAGEARCAEAVAAVERLPGAGASADAADRADVVDRADAIYDEMLGDLEGQAHLAPSGDQRDRVEAWLADWRLYMGDRAAYADALRANPDARLLVSEKPGEGRQVTGWIDEFALANRMPSCATPADV